MYSVQLTYVFTVDIKSIFKFIGLSRWSWLVLVNLELT